MTIGAGSKYMRIARVHIFAAIFILLSTICGCGVPSFRNDGLNLKTPLNREIPSLDLHRTALGSLPSYDAYSDDAMQVDLRSYDLTNLKLDDRFNDLIHSDFDTGTIWPYWLPDGFDPKKIIAFGKNPGLGIQSLHEQGITGDGISIAIISGVLLPDHDEYRHALAYYQEYNCSDAEASVDGCQQASIAAGKTAGVAPGAKLYYFAVNDINVKYMRSNMDVAVDEYKYKPLVNAINKVVEINRGLDGDEKIRVLCLGEDIQTSEKGYPEVEAAVRKAQDSGIFVVSTFLYETSGHEMDFSGLGRDPMADPDAPASYRPGQYYLNDYYSSGRYVHTKDGLLFPMDSRATASPTGKNDYAFYSTGSPDLCVPYIGGLYALACQVNPEVTPDVFWDMALETGDALYVTVNGTQYSLKKVINPVRLIKRVKSSD